MTFQELLARYNKRQTSRAVADSMLTGLSLADDLSGELGLVAEGALADALNVASFGLPMAAIALHEQYKVRFKGKTKEAAQQDTRHRLTRTGIAMGAGAAAVAAGAGSLIAIPVSMGTRLVIDRYRSRTMLSHRIQKRRERLNALLSQRSTRQDLLRLG